jgi:hypothetical protein
VPAAHIATSAAIAVLKPPNSSLHFQNQVIQKRILVTSARIIVAAVLAVGLLPSAATLAQTDRQPCLKTTVLGTRFEVRPEFETTIDEVTSALRSTLKAERSQGKLICYLSIPLSSAGGGYRPINGEVAEHVKNSLQEEFGADKFFVLAPGLAESSLRAVGGVQPGGGEYMYLWTNVLAGEDGLGSDFDVVYFAGRSDFFRYFAIQPPRIVVGLENWMTARAESDAAFKTAIMDAPAVRRGFITYYATKAGIAFSNGAHDEWNIFVKVNRARAGRPNLGLSGQIPCYFDRRPLTPPEMEREVQPGYERIPNP